MVYPLQLEDVIHARLVDGDLRGAKQAEKRFVRALRRAPPDAPRVLIQLLAGCLMQARRDLVDVFGEVSEIPTPSEIATVLSRRRTCEGIIDAFESIITLMFVAVQTYDSAMNSLPFRARLFVRSNFDRHISTRTVAEAVACSEAHLCVVFRQAYGCTVGQYIRRQRIELAKSLLKATQLPVKCVGYRAGFCTYRTFLRAFHVETGLSPLGFRRAGARDEPWVVAESRKTLT